MPRRALRRRRSPSPVSSEASSKSSRRSSSPESVAEERFAPLRAGDIVCVPVREEGETSMSLALVIEAPGSGSGMGLLLEAKEDLHRDGCVDPRVDRRGGFYITNTHVSLETATALSPGIMAMIFGEGHLSGLYWETDLGPESTRVVMELTPQYREYIDAVRKHGLADAVPESCRAKLDAALHRGGPKTDAEKQRLQRLLMRHDPVVASYPDETVCVACGAFKRCSHLLGHFPLGGDCARELRRVKPVCDFVYELQRQSRIPYPHDFQRMLEDALGK